MVSLVSALAVARLETAEQGGHAPHGDSHPPAGHHDLRLYQFKSPAEFDVAGRNLVALHLLGSIGTAAFTFRLFQKFRIMNTVAGRLGWGFINLWTSYASMNMTDNVITEIKLTPNRESVLVRTGFISPVTHRVKLGDFRLEKRHAAYTSFTLRGLEAGDRELVLPATEENERFLIPQQDLFRSIVTGDAARIKQLLHA